MVAGTHGRHAAKQWQRDVHRRDRGGPDCRARAVVPWPSPRPTLTTAATSISSSCRGPVVRCCSATSAPARSRMPAAGRRARRHRLHLAGRWRREQGRLHRSSARTRVGACRMDVERPRRTLPRERRARRHARHDRRAVDRLRQRRARRRLRRRRRPASRVPERGERLAGARRGCWSASSRTALPQSSVRAVAAGDLDQDGDTDLVSVLQGGALRIWRNEGGNANRAVQVALTGRASNRAGIGAKVEVRAGSLYQRVETSAATPPVTAADVTIGLGSRAGADAIRVLWPSGVLQTEIPAPAPGALARVPLTELDRAALVMPVPVHLEWRGFEFVTDFLGGGEMGYLEAPPAHRNTPDPDEYVRITRRTTSGARRPVRAPGNERAGGGAVPRPPGAHSDDACRRRRTCFPTKRFGCARRPRRPTRFARHSRRAPLLTSTVTTSSRRSRAAIVRSLTISRLLGVRGYAAEHALTLDLAGAPPRAARERTVLLLTGWSDYAFSSDNVRAHQAGLTLMPPALQVETSAGSWQTVDADMGIPVGRPQTLVLDVTAYAPRRVRILTSMRIYWDQVLVGTATVDTRIPAPGFRFWAPTCGGADSRRKNQSAAGLCRTTIAWCRMRLPGSSCPDATRVKATCGSCLHAADDRFVIARPGDELVLSFDASALPPLPHGMRRTFLLYSVGFSKEMDLHSASPDVVQPIPFRAMRTYPVHVARAVPASARHRSVSYPRRATRNTDVAFRGHPVMTPIRYTAAACQTDLPNPTDRTQHAA